MAIAPELTPLVDVIVPTYNEVAFIAGKLQNLTDLDYSRDRIAFWIVDGGSDDGTQDAVRARASADARFTLIQTDARDKTAQLNVGLLHCRAPWVLVSDADASLPRETLREMVWTAQTDPAVAVVGAPIRPAGGHPLERLHWSLMNRLHVLERRCGSAMCVAAPALLFERPIVERLEADVVADDVYIAWTAALAGRRVGMTATPVSELRSPGTMAGLYRHKRLKAEAYLREVFRFLPRCWRMPARLRALFLVHTSMLLVLPALAASLALASAVWLALNAPLVLLALGVTLPFAAPTRCQWRPVRAVWLIALLAAAGVAALAGYPLRRSRSRHLRARSVPWIETLP